MLLLNPLKRDLQIRICQCDCDSHSGSGNNLSPFNLVTTTEKKTWKYSRCKKIPEHHSGKIHNTNPSNSTSLKAKILESNPWKPGEIHRCWPPHPPKRPVETPAFCFLAWLPTPAAPFGADLGWENSLAFWAFLGLHFLKAPPKKRHNNNEKLF